jgi:hypothetical protein
MGRTCPSCGKPVERGETRCERCGEPLAVGPLGSTSPAPLIWLGRLLAIGALIIPGVALAAILIAIGLIAIHDLDTEPLVIIGAAAIFGAVGYLLNDGFTLLSQLA